LFGEIRSSGRCDRPINKARDIVGRPFRVMPRDDSAEQPVQVISLRKLQQSRIEDNTFQHPGGIGVLRLRSSV